MERTELLKSLVNRVRNARKITSRGHVGGVIYDIPSLSQAERDLLQEIVDAAAQQVAVSNINEI